jgi:hypothetical protein
MAQQIHWLVFVFALLSFSVAALSLRHPQVFVVAIA